MEISRWGEDEDEGCVGCKWHRWKVQPYHRNGLWFRSIVGCYCKLLPPSLYLWPRSRRGTILWEPLACDYLEWHWEGAELGEACPMREDK